MQLPAAPIPLTILYSGTISNASLLRLSVIIIAQSAQKVKLRQAAEDKN
jgi:hypothetical protein